MNIWIFNHYAISPDMPGGTRHYDLSRELVNRGHKVVVFAASFNHYVRREMRLQAGESWKIEDVNGVTFVWIRIPPYQGNDWRRARGMVVFMLKSWLLGRKLPRLLPEIDPPDVILGSSVHLLAVLAAYWLSKHYHVRFVMEVRDLWPQTLIDMGALGQKSLFTRVLQMLEKYLYHRAQAIVTLLPQAHEYITTCGVPRNKVVWIPNGVDLSRFAELPKPDTIHEGFWVMYLGAHGQANALDVLLYAAKIIQDQGNQDIRFILVGDGSEKLNLVKLARELDLRILEFRDPVHKNLVPQVASNADAFIFNLESVGVFRYGISSNKLFDYMALGKPIIFSVLAINNPIEEAECGITVPPRDPEALANAIMKLYHMSPTERLAMGQRGRAYVEKYHDMRKLAEKLEKVLETDGPKERVP